jgi:hypothetical protein
MGQRALWTPNGACVLAGRHYDFDSFCIRTLAQARAPFDFAQGYLRLTIISFFCRHCLHQERKSLLETIVACFAALEVPHADYDQIVRRNNEGGLASRA